ncbi:type II toxin-antitoxin system RelB/DinJ family antitoxin [Escherichia coli]|nr:type II toxin-antitoxin system RelB/DinJ family antitoxin [Escherichia coli]
MNVRIESELKERATDALNEMGVTMSDAVRYTLEYIAQNRRLPAEPVYVGADDDDDDIIEIVKARISDPNRKTIRVDIEDLLK